MTKRKRKNGRAFTLIELMTVMAIFAVMSVLVMANYKDFGARTILKNLAYKVALSIREAQVSGITGRNLNISSGDYNTSYGVFFSSAYKNKYIFFADNNPKNSRYDSGEEVEVFTLSAGHEISNICVFSNISGTCDPVSNLHISFKRPEPDAYIYSESGGPYQAASIEISGSGGRKLYVHVLSSGQITTQWTNSL